MGQLPNFYVKSLEREHTPEFLLKSKWLLIYNLNFKRAFYVREIPNRHRLRPGDVILYEYDSSTIARDSEYLINRAKKANRSYGMVYKILNNNITQCISCKKFRRHRAAKCGKPIDLCRQCVGKLIAKHPRTIFINSKKMMWYLDDPTDVWNNSMYRLSCKGYVYMFQKYNISLHDLAKEKYPFPSDFKKKYDALIKRYKSKIEEHNSFTTQKGRIVKEFDYPQLYESEVVHIDRKITELKYAALQRGEREIRPLCKGAGKNRKRGKPVKLLKRPYESQWAKYKREKQELLTKERESRL